MENGLLVDRKRISESKHLHTRETYNINRQKIKWAKIYTHILENRKCVISKQEEKTSAHTLKSKEYNISKC